MMPNRLAQDDRAVDYPGPSSYSSAMPANRDRPAKPAAPPAAGSAGVDDLTWLAYRAAGALGEAFNKVSRDAGLADLRDWLVLALISGDGTQRTQLQIAGQLRIHKTTLVSLVDRRGARGRPSPPGLAQRAPAAAAPGRPPPPASRSSRRSPSPGTQPSTIVSR